MLRPQLKAGGAAVRVQLATMQVGGHNFSSPSPPKKRRGLRIIYRFH